MSFRGNRNRGKPVSNIRRQLFKDFDETPGKVVLLGQFTHACQDDLVVKSKIKDVPFFNAPVFTESKQQIGKVDEIFGQVTDYYVSVRLSVDISVQSFEIHQKLFIDPGKLLPLQRFLQKESRGIGRGRGRGRGRGTGSFNIRRGHSETPRRGIRGRGSMRFRGRGRGRFNSSQRWNPY